MEPEWNCDQWQLSALEKLINVQYGLCNGCYRDAQDIATDLVAIAEYLSGMPVNLVGLSGNLGSPMDLDLVAFNTDGGVYPEDEV
jgi:hypothetical protein